MFFKRLETGSRPPLGIVAAVFLALLASACATIEPREGVLSRPGDAAAAPNPLDPSALFKPTPSAPPPTEAVKRDRNAMDKRLAVLGVKFKRLPDIENDRGCRQVDTVEMTGVGDVTFTRPALVTADLAERLGRWVNDVVTPAAKTAGRQLAAIDVYGSYSCRNAYGRPFGSLRGRLSQHAYANAVDIGGFKFKDGAEIQYKKDWKAAGTSRNFIHSVSLAGCEMFNTTLTPDYDRYHWHHIHLDASPNNQLCGYAGKFNKTAAAKSIPPGKAAFGKGSKSPAKSRTPAANKKPAGAGAKTTAAPAAKKRQTVVIPPRA
jgi:hypothetical protein